MAHKRGGKREGAGRPGSGLVAKRVALSLSPGVWGEIENAGVSVSEYLRRILALKDEKKQEPPPFPQLGEVSPINLRSFFYGWEPVRIVEWIGGIQPITDIEKQEHVMSWEDAVKYAESVYQSQFHEIMHNRALHEYPEKCGIGPSAVESILSCSKTERKRWESDGRLPVIDRFETGSRRNRVWVPMYDRRVIERLSPADLERWRIDDQTTKRNQRTQLESEVSVSRFVLIEAIAQGKVPYRIFGPIRTNLEGVDTLWERHRQHIPWEWDVVEGSILMRDYHSGEVLRLERF